MYYPSYIFVLQDHRLGWSDLSAFTFTRRSLRRRPVGWAARYLILRQRTGWIVCRFIVSYAGGLPAKLGTSSVDSPVGLIRFADAACHVWYQGVPCCPDLGADPGWHVKGFDKYIYRSNPVLSTFCFLHILLLGIIEFYSMYPVLSVGTLSFTLHSLILLQDVFYLTARSGTKYVYFTLRWMYYFSSY